MVKLIANWMARPAMILATGIQAREAPAVGTAAAMAEAIWMARATSCTTTTIFSAITRAPITNRQPPMIPAAEPRSVTTCITLSWLS